MDIEIWVKYQIPNFCTEDELKGTNLTELVEWMVVEEGLHNFVLGVPGIITKVKKAKSNEV